MNFLAKENKKDKHFTEHGNDKMEDILETVNETLEHRYKRHGKY